MEDPRENQLRLTWLSHEKCQSILGERNVLREKINSAETTSERSILVVCIAIMRTAKGTIRVIRPCYLETRSLSCSYFISIRYSPLRNAVLWNTASRYSTADNFKQYYVKVRNDVFIKQV